MVYSEAVYVLAALGGETDAHERVRAATLRAEKTGARLSEVLRQDPGLWDLLARQLSHVRGLDADAFFSDPASYRGLAPQRARAIADSHEQALHHLQEGLSR
jgi:adenylosuccinate lyase